jgi:uncharacterized protein YyaL (SSP411 family)
MTHSASNEKWLQSLQKVRKWVEDRKYKGYDPGDGLTTFLRPLTMGNIFAERVLQQLIWKAPVNIRPLVGVKPLDSTKGRGFMAWGYMLLYKALGDGTCLQRATECLDWLDQNREAGYAGHCWGNHFDFTTRSGRMVAHTPTIVWTGLIGQAFLETFEQTGNERYLEICRSICQWILTLPRETTETGTCLSYTGRFQNSVHNSNLLGAAMLARTWRHTRTDEYLEMARSAVQYTCTRQREDGSWWYGEKDNYHWIDNFHTAYNLDSIKRYTEGSGDTQFLPQMDRGYDYFKRVFFEKDGRPRYYHDKTHPVDIQCAAQAIDTFSYFSDRDADGLSMAAKVADWTIDNMQAPSGNFYYRKYPVLTAKTPYFHWGQSTTFKGLAHLVERTKAAASGAAPVQKAA